MKFKVKSKGIDHILNTEDVQNIDLISTDQGYHVIEKNIGYQVKSIGEIGKSMSLDINGTSYDIEISNQYDLLVNKMGLSAVNNTKASSVKAPMPGLILEINVSPGDHVQEGDALTVLEAMKMENVLRAVGEGVVKSVEVEKGQTVDKGQLLIEME